MRAWAARPPADLDTSVAHPARVYEYWLGGKDNFAADRANCPAESLSSVDTCRAPSRRSGAADPAADDYRPQRHAFALFSLPATGRVPITSRSG
jgi:S-adenosyl methyltransferase